jgi:hypothetical protein
MDKYVVFVLAGDEGVIKLGVVERGAPIGNGHTWLDTCGTCVFYTSMA